MIVSLIPASATLTYFVNVLGMHYFVTTGTFMQKQMSYEFMMKNLQTAQ